MRFLGVCAVMCGIFKTTILLGNPSFYLSIDNHYYPIEIPRGDIVIGIYQGVSLADTAIIRNCHRSNGAQMTLSESVFVGNNGASYVYLRGEMTYHILGQVAIFGLETTDGDVICDFPLPFDPTSDTIFSNNYE